MKLETFRGLVKIIADSKVDKELLRKFASSVCVSKYEETPELVEKNNLLIFKIYNG